eukprot:CAMPEP_0174244844 /NCGR_PEP_ID=MMETSP0417-20130205/36779_1 /TAXON_ID=242541 /ORGANISM="Mayorella sp, Strain BSH-02190019" /LENGTH=790 /DNA_ID=CAMNT_0015324571 /DNA_START=47 /DNA_END=2419 /DNA_ORIENTATION=+
MAAEATEYTLASRALRLSGLNVVDDMVEHALNLAEGDVAPVSATPGSSVGDTSARRNVMGARSTSGGRSVLTHSQLRRNELHLSSLPEVRRKINVLLSVEACKQTPDAEARTSVLTELLRRFTVLEEEARARARAKKQEKQKEQREQNEQKNEEAEAETELVSGSEAGELAAAATPVGDEEKDAEDEFVPHLTMLFLQDEDGEEEDDEDAEEDRQVESESSESSAVAAGRNSGYDTSSEGEGEVLAAGCSTDDSDTAQGPESGYDTDEEQEDECKSSAALPPGESSVGEDAEDADSKKPIAGSSKIMPANLGRFGAEKPHAAEHEQSLLISDAEDVPSVDGSVDPIAPSAISSPPSNSLTGAQIFQHRDSLQLTSPRSGPCANCATVVKNLVSLELCEHRSNLCVSCMHNHLASFVQSGEVEKICCYFKDECDASPTMQDLELFLTGEEYDAFIEFSVIASIVASELLKKQQEESESSEPLEECLVCFDEYPTSEFVSLKDCGHRYCPECITTMILTCVNNNEAKSVKCMDPSCGRTLEDDEVSSYIDSENFQRYTRFKQLSVWHADSNARWCPRPNCETAVIVEDPKQSRALCPTCNTEWCLKCKLRHEPELSCSKAKKLLDGAKLEKAAKKWAKKHCKPCPQCGTVITKNGGCHNVHCSQCRCCFCWQCGQKNVRGKRHCIGLRVRNGIAVGLLLPPAIALAVGLAVPVGVPALAAVKTKRKIKRRKIKKIGHTAYYAKRSEKRQKRLAKTGGQKVKFQDRSVAHKALYTVADGAFYQLGLLFGGDEY